MDKPFLHKLNVISDWILRIVIINLLLIVCTFLVITLYPGIYAAYRLFKDYKEGKNTPIFNGFWTYFKEQFKTKIQISLTLILIILIGVYSLFTYNDFIGKNEGMIYLIGYYVVLMFLIGFVIVTLFTIPIIIYFKEASIGNMYKLSLYIMGRYFYIAFLTSILWVIPLILIFIPQLMVIYVIAGLSLTVLLWILISGPLFRFLERISKNVQTGN